MRVSTLILHRFAKRYRFALGFNLAEGAAPKNPQKNGKILLIGKKYAKVHYFQ